ncbi:MAG: hypothetical protein WA939_23155 [Nodosilinea sp.]
MVPVHVDALYLPIAEAVAEPTADFRGLPYYDSEENRDINSDTPWLGDSVVSPPFENSNLTLQKGIHLHWALPDGLCHGRVVEGDGSIEMPAVPNRWLIHRHDTEASADETWVIESDYLWPTADYAPAVNIFREITATEKRPYRFLGRKLTLTDWLEGFQAGDYLDKLTAIGHGDPSFAAYYPNSMSVFGFHDRALPDNWNTLQYDIIGWYQRSSPLLDWQADPKNTGSQIEPQRGWRIGSVESPQHIFCYASVQVIKTGRQVNSPKDLKVAVGTTASEALSALLAREIAGEIAAETQLTALEPAQLVTQIEEQLEALHIAGQLAAAKQDQGLQLQRYRHQKSFESVPGSQRWTLQVNTPGASPPPEALLQTLRELNQAQAQYGQQLSRLQQARRQLYGDWCHYMRCAYRPPDGGQGQFLDLDEVVTYIETRSLADVKYFADIVASTDKSLQTMHQSLGKQLKQLNEELEQAAATSQSDNAEPLPLVQYRLQSEPGSRFWQPADPVVLLAGGTLKPSDRHGRDGRHDADGWLQCHLWETEVATTEGVMRQPQSRDALLQQVKEWFDQYFSSKIEPSLPCLGLQKINVEARPWNAVFLEWGIDLHPAESSSPVVPSLIEALPTPVVDERYSPDIITRNYQLGSRQPDLQLSDNWWIRDNPDRFSGRCIVADAPSLAFKERIEEVIERRLLDGTAETWANPQEQDYFERLTGWYGGSDRPTHLPKTPVQLQALMSWYRQRPLKSGTTLDKVAPLQRATDPLYCALRAYEQLFDNAQSKVAEPLRLRAFLSQALSGFNGELLQWKLGLSLPIEEPIGLAPYKEFTQDVATAVQDETAWATEPTNNFSPIRSGALKLDKLRLVDSFGQVVEVDCDEQVIIPSLYRLLGRPGIAFLPPRLVQPAHITFRWLDADAHQLKEPAQEMETAAARSPICGWLLPEKLRGRLLVFDGDGQPLGAIAADTDNARLEWVPAPGLPALDEVAREAGRRWLERVGGRYYANASQGQSPATLSDLGELGASLQNQRLARVLLYLWATRSPLFLEQFLNTLDNAIGNIDPEGTASMGSMALLVGRPVAVVGAELNLELKDDPAVRQDWGAFMLDQYRHYRDTDDFTQVQFRLRLGQYQSRNDGVLGYWLEDADGFAENTFTAQAADDNDPNRSLDLTVEGTGLTFQINAHGSGEAIDDLNFTQSVETSALHTTLLFDPRGQATLTSGILPVKQIDIPRSLWEPALEAIRVWLPVGPILTRPQNRAVPTPALVGRQWSWLEAIKTSDQVLWQSLLPRPTVDRALLQTALTQLKDPPFNLEPPEVEQLMAKGWLAELERPGDRLYVLSREDRQPLDDWSLEEPLDALLTQLAQALIPPSDAPNFTLGTEVREGWLLLEPSPEKT